MTANSIVRRLLEAPGPVNPDDPQKFLQHYQDKFERAGFVRVDADPRDEELIKAGFTPMERQRWVWRDERYEVVIGEQGNHPNTYYTITAYVSGGKDPAGGIKKNACVSVSANTDKKALQVAQKYRKEMPTWMATRLIKLGFTGWNNYWHRAPIDVSLKKDSVNIKFNFRFMPNEKAIKFLTGLNKVCDKILGPPDEL